MSRSRKLDLNIRFVIIETCFTLKACTRVCADDMVILRHGAQVPRCFKYLRSRISDEVLLQFIWACIGNVFAIPMFQEFFDDPITFILELGVVMPQVIILVITG